MTYTNNVKCSVKIISARKYTAQATKTNLKHKIENIELLTTFFTSFFY